MPLGEARAEAAFAGRGAGLFLRLGSFLGWLLLFRSLKDKLGFSRIRSACTGGAALGPDTFRFFHAIGVNLKQIYGQTEIAVITSYSIHYTKLYEPGPRW